MSVLTDDSGNYVEYKGRKFRIRASFDVVLLLQRLYQEENLEPVDKINQALKMLTRDPIRVWCLTELEKAELLQKITDEKIKLPPRPKVGKQQKLMDFEADAEYIYASFRQAYGMNLVKEKGRLQWQRFCDLLDGLPEGTKLREVMKIRAMDIPDPTKYNQKERQSIMELKSYYALPVKGGGGQDGLDMLFSALEGVAIRS